MPDAVIKALEDKAERLVSKYSVTFNDIETQIRETSLSLALMIDNLTGNDSDMTGLMEFQKLLKD